MENMNVSWFSVTCFLDTKKNCVLVMIQFHYAAYIFIIISVNTSEESQSEEEICEADVIADFKVIINERE